jgi:hypothetical protein
MTQKDLDRRMTTADDAALDKEMAHDDIQQGADQSIPKQDQLKRAIQQHPQRELPRVESLEAPEVPPRI